MRNHGALLLGTLAFAMVMPAMALAQLNPPDDPFNPNHNYKDMIIEWGAGRSDRDAIGQKPSGEGGQVHPPWEGDRIPDVFQAWMVMYAEQAQPATYPYTAAETLAIIDGNRAAAPLFKRPTGYYISYSKGGYDHVRAFWLDNGIPAALFDPALYDFSLHSVFGPDADPDGDNSTNLEEFENTLRQYGLPVAPPGVAYGGIQDGGVSPDQDFWTDEQWEIAFETYHSLGVGFPGPREGYVENDVMTTFAAVAFDPNRVPEPAAISLLALGGLGLWRRRR